MLSRTLSFGVAQLTYKTTISIVAYKGLKAACIGQQGRLCRPGRIAEGTGRGFQARLQRAIADAPACEAPVSSFSLQPSENANEFEVQVYSRGSTERVPSKRVSRTEFGELVKPEFAGREWAAQFTYQTDFPLPSALIL
jgi:hypothetical protein